MAKSNSNKKAKSPAKGRTNKKKYTIFVTHSGKEMRFEDAVKVSDYEIQMADSIKQTLTFDTKKAFNEYKTQKIEEAPPPRGNNKCSPMKKKNYAKTDNKQIGESEGTNKKAGRI